MLFVRGVSGNRLGALFLSPGHSCRGPAVASPAQPVCLFLSPLSFSPSHPAYNTSLSAAGKTNGRFWLGWKLGSGGAGEVCLLVWEGAELQPPTSPRPPQSWAPSWPWEAGETLSGPPACQICSLALKPVPAGPRARCPCVQWWLLWAGPGLLIFSSGAWSGISACLTGLSEVLRWAEAGLLLFPGASSS